MNKKYLIEFLCYHFSSKGLTWEISPIITKNNEFTTNQIVFYQDALKLNFLFGRTFADSKNTGWLVTFNRPLTTDENKLMMP